MAHWGDPIGWIYEGDVYCPDCVGNEPDDNPEYGPVWEETETDSPMYCGNWNCKQFIGGALTDEGWKQLKDYIRRSLHMRCDAVYDLMHYYSHYDWYFIPTFEGMMDPTREIKRWD